mmetsp:Transcript_11243/g.13541  ORF Transcript_11243/g.13541 Transcript_11243/m.13541 type:complete len:222 (+) Transcript_11243:18179-18844(+)
MPEVIVVKVVLKETPLNHYLWCLLYGWRTWIVWNDLTVEVLVEWQLFEVKSIVCSLKNTMLYWLWLDLLRLSHGSHHNFLVQKIEKMVRVVRHQLLVVEPCSNRKDFGQREPRTILKILIWMQSLVMSLSLLLNHALMQEERQLWFMKKMKQLENYWHLPCMVLLVLESPPHLEKHSSLINNNLVVVFHHLTLVFWFQLWVLMLPPRSRKMKQVSLLNLMV